MLDAVLIKCPEDPSGWAIIELQGTIVNKNGPLNGETLGRFQIGKVPELIIGNHKLLGSIVNLNKPMLVVQKNENRDSVQNNHLAEWDVFAIVRTKYFFVISKFSLN